MSDEEKLDPTEIEAALEGLPGWEEQGGRLRREYRTTGWPHTLLLVGGIACRAEAAYHHPDLEVSFPRVVVWLVTHDAGGITAKDVALAREIEAVATWRPPEESPLPGFPGDWTR